MTDLDKSGYGFQRVRTYLGPTLGWTEEYVQPMVDLKVGGVYNVQPGDSIILVNATALVTINLPDVRLWVQQKANQPATGFDRSITVKDFGGNAANFNIVIAPFGQQGIDNIQQAVVLSVSRSVMKLIPLNDLTGWISEVASVQGGSSGGGDVFKAGNNTFTATNTFLGPVKVPTVLANDDSDNAASTAYVQDQNFITGVSLEAYAPLFTPIFTGNPQAPTPPHGDNDTTIATTAFVQDAMSVAGAPTDAEYVVASNNPVLTNERTFQDSASIQWDLTVPGKVRANATGTGLGNVSNFGAPVAGQLAEWVTPTSIKGIDKSSLGFQPAGFYQPLDGDLTALSALTGTNTIYYRSATDIWSPVAFSGMTFSGGVLTATGGGSVNVSGVPTLGQTARWTNLNTIEGHQVFVGSATAPAGPLSPGDFWYDLSTGALSVRTDDGTSQQWLQIAPAGGGGPTSSFPAGTLMLFQQTAAPTGWTKQTTHNDKAMRIVSGTASQGGSVGFQSLFSRTGTDGFTLSTTEMPSHTHPYNAQSNGSVGGDGAVGGSGADFNPVTLASGGNQAHAHTMDMRVLYVDFIIASKD